MHQVFLRRIKMCRPTLNKDPTLSTEYVMLTTNKNSFLWASLYLRIDVILLQGDIYFFSLIQLLSSTSCFGNTTSLETMQLTSIICPFGTGKERMHDIPWICDFPWCYNEHSFLNFHSRLKIWYSEGIRWFNRICASSESRTFAAFSSE